MLALKARQAFIVDIFIIGKINKKTIKYLLYCTNIDLYYNEE